MKKGDKNESPYGEKEGLLAEALGRVTQGDGKLKIMVQQN
tara:strand:- start:156 stop:275 length:120 start_codon:yes stop_codon:yes gene_type:complete